MAATGVSVFAIGAAVSTFGVGAGAGFGGSFSPPPHPPRSKSDAKVTVPAIRRAQHGIAP
ncbi:MAG: hypothetical protein HYU36_25420 [Planctomycetes bacterium]|nr:hypothetical protein [Planctomycetota bacterium]